MKTIFGFLVAVALLWPTPARVAPFYAQAFHLYSTCSGGDEVYRWTIDGWPQLGWNIKAWLEQDIYVFGIAITMFTGDTSPLQQVWWMIGSNYSSGDTILFLGPGEVGKQLWFPAGKSLHIPNKNTPGWDTRYLDLHGICFGGGPVNAWITLYYTYSE